MIKINTINKLINFKKMNVGNHLLNPSFFKYVLANTVVMFIST